MSLKRVSEYIKRNKSFLITTHTNLEGDAIGSEIAFYWLLKKMGKQTTIINEDKPPYGYEFLPKIDKIKKFKQKFKKIKFDCFVILDCSDLMRSGDIHKLNLKNKPILNIDHHISNEKFGNINWIDPKASSCCEMIYRLYKKFAIPFDRISATALYVGMLTDTGSFRYSNTSSFTHRAISELMNYGLDVKEIYSYIYENIPFSDMKLLIKILPSMKRLAGGKIVWFEIRRAWLKNRRISFDLSEYVLSFGRAIKDVEVAVLFKENLGQRRQVRVNFRSGGKIDVNKIAQIFGGGGHKNASGCTIYANIEDAKRKVLTKLKAAVGRL
jgi:phosphoesterase RecJ-like protein